MRQWEIYDYPFPDPIGPHPVIIVSPDDIAGNKDCPEVNVIMGVSIRGGRPLKDKIEVQLNGADGLDGPTAAKVYPIRLVLKKDLGRQRGTVSLARRDALKRKIKEVFRLF